MTYTVHAHTEDLALGLLQQLLLEPDSTPNIVLVHCHHAEMGRRLPALLATRLQVEAVYRRPGVHVFRGRNLAFFTQVADNRLDQRFVTHVLEYRPAFLDREHVLCQSCGQRTAASQVAHGRYGACPACQSRRLVYDWCEPQAV